MDRDRWQEILDRTLDDGRLSRAERKALRALAEEASPEDLAAARRLAFERAREAATDDRGRGLVDWLEDVQGALREEPPGATLCEVHFSPGDACRSRIEGLIDGASRTIDVCVYTLTDDRIAGALLTARERGVTIRLISDDEKADDLGSDVDRLRAAGVAVAFDGSPSQMHHKFAVFDGATAITGSYNWTRSAADQNQENVVVSDDPRLVGALAGEFERLWERFR